MNNQTKELPAHIGGYQKLEPWVVVEEGDIWVQGGKPVEFVFGSDIGRTVEAAEKNVGTLRIYRKMPLPRNHCEVDWDKQDTQFANSECKAREAGSPDPEKVLSEKLAHFAGQLAKDMKAKTDDANKPPLAHLPWGALDEVAMVQSYGHQKYGDFYNYKKGMEVSRNISCAIRHLRAYMNGEDNDPESARPHLAHAACRILFALQNIKDGKAIDDRFKP